MAGQVLPALVARRGGSLGASWLLPALGMAPMGPARLAGPSHELTGTASAERKARQMRFS